jgi:hypothetical protein
MASDAWQDRRHLSTKAVRVLQGLADWRPETDEACVIVTGDDRVLPFASWEDAKYFYREGANLLEDALGSARFFVCREGRWSEVMGPGFAN